MSFDPQFLARSSHGNKQDCRSRSSDLVDDLHFLPDSEIARAHARSYESRVDRREPRLHPFKDCSLRAQEIDGHLFAFQPREQCFEKHDPTHVRFQRFSKRTAAPNDGVFGYDKLRLPYNPLERGNLLCEPKLVCIDGNNVVKAALSNKCIDSGYSILHVQAVDWISQQVGS
jgi:hypothetical protein